MPLQVNGFPSSPFPTAPFVFAQPFQPLKRPAPAVPETCSTVCRRGLRHCPSAGRRRHTPCMPAAVFGRCTPSPLQPLQPLIKPRQQHYTCCLQDGGHCITGYEVPPRHSMLECLSFTGQCLADWLGDPVARGSHRAHPSCCMTRVLPAIADQHQRNQVRLRPHGNTMRGRICANARLQQHRARTTRRPDHVRTPQSPAVYVFVQYTIVHDSDAARVHQLILHSLWLVGAPLPLQCACARSRLRSDSLDMLLQGSPARDAFHTQLFAQLAELPAGRPRQRRLRGCAPALWLIVAGLSRHPLGTSGSGTAALWLAVPCTQAGFDLRRTTSVQLCRDLGFVK